MHVSLPESLAALEVGVSINLSVGGASVVGLTRPNLDFLYWPAAAANSRHFAAISVTSLA
jgi:hypothetical protein